MEIPGNILDLPGNLGPVRGSLLSIHHGIWPTYPQGENFQETLFHMSAFPIGTGFQVISDIDRSLLLVADIPCGDLSDPFHARNFHISAWHEDLAEMQSKGFIEGVKSANQSQWEKIKWDDILAEVPGASKLYIKDSSGNLKEIFSPKFIEVDEEDEEYEFKDQSFVITPEKRISITENGRNFIRSLLAAMNVDFSIAISPKVSKLFDLKFFDTCVREACVQLEHEIKEKIGSVLYGDRLTDKYIEYLQKERKHLESAIRTYGQELRAVFKLIRNEYMHNLSEIDERQAYSVLFRISRVRSMLQVN